MIVEEFYITNYCKRCQMNDNHRSLSLSYERFTQRKQKSTQATWNPCAQCKPNWCVHNVCWVRDGLRWVREAFYTPTCWYWQRETLVLGVVLNTNGTQRELVHALLECRLFRYIQCSARMNLTSLFYFVISLYGNSSN